MIAEVILRQGRYFLVVRGVYVAMEGDVCRDPLFTVGQWNENALRTVCHQINANTWRSAAHRFTNYPSTMKRIEEE